MRTKSCLGQLLSNNCLEKKTIRLCNQLFGLGFGEWRWSHCFFRLYDFRLDSWVPKMPWRMKRQLTPVFLPRKSHGQRHSLSEKCKSKPLWGTISHQSEWLRSKSLQAINAGEGVEKREANLQRIGYMHFRLRMSWLLDARSEAFFIVFIFQNALSRSLT